MLRKIFHSLRSFDWHLIINILLLMFFGLAALYSLQLNVSKPDFTLFQRQAVFFLIGLLLFFIFSRINFGSLVLLSLAATLFYNLILIILIRLFIPISVLFGSISFKDGSWPVNPYSFYSILLEAVYNTILITLIFYGIKKIFYQKQFR